MASQQTPNYNLNQWIKTDRILMDDFNADNQKIDAAIAGRLGPIEEIKSMTLSETAYSFSLDISDIDWSKWSIVFVEASYQISCNTSGNGSLRLELVDAHLATVAQGAMSLASSTRSTAMMLVLFPARNGGTPSLNLSFPDGQVYQSTLALQEATSISSSMALKGAKFLDGTTVRLRGIR